MAEPRCPHCHVPMRLYETVQKADGPYGRYECPNPRCPKCSNSKCTERIGPNHPVAGAVSVSIAATRQVI
jgi:hypothetical protein